MIKQRKRKYNLPTYVCWDISQDLFHARFSIKDKWYSFHKKTLLEIMQCVITTMVSNNVWTEKEATEYAHSYELYKDFTPPETCRYNHHLNKKVKILPNIVEMLIQVAKASEYNKDMHSLQLKAESTAEVLSVLKGKTNGNKPTLVYKNELSGFKLTFCNKFSDNLLYCHLIINRRIVKVIIEKADSLTEQNVCLGIQIYTIKQFCKNNLTLDELIHTTITNFNTRKEIEQIVPLTIEEMKNILCDL